MCEKRLVVIFGAGATNAFVDGLSTRYITDEILKINNWEGVKEKVEREYNSTKKAAGSSLDISVGPIKKVLDIIRNVSGDYEEDVTFEDIVYLFDLIFSHIEGVKNKFYHIDTFLLRCIGSIMYDNEVSKTVSPTNAHYYPYILREVIIDAILKKWNEYKKAGTYSDDLLLNKSFIEELKNVFASVSLYSLNYDPLLYESNNLIENGRYITGFETGDNQFFPDKFYSENQNTNNKDKLNSKTLAFLHGHVGFCAKGGKLGGEIIFNDGYENNYKKRIGCWWNFGGEAIYDSFIVSGRYTDKMGAYIFNPYTTYMSKYSVDLQKATHILLIGAGLSDYHLLLHFNRCLFPEKKIIIVNKECKSIDCKMDTTHWRKMLTRVYKTKDNALWKFVFGGEYTIANSDLQRYVFDRYISLSDGKVVFYHKGAKDFFNESVDKRNELLIGDINEHS